MLDLPLHLVATERPLISIDGTLFLNFALWIVLFLLLRGLLWGPMIRLITAREKGTTGSRDEARRLETEAREKRAEFEAAQKRARAAAAEARDKLRAEGARLEAQILAEARESVNAEVERQRAQIRVQRETLRTEVQATVPSLASDIASKVLGREVRV